MNDANQSLNTFTNTDRRLIYQARRGLKELDMFIDPYIKTHFVDASDAEKATFSRLVAAEDPDLLDWFMEKSTPEDVELAALILKIKSLKFDH